jgi:hypothetical protein
LVVSRGKHVRSPRIKCSTLLSCPIVTLIHAGDAATTAADVIQNRFGDLESDAKPLQTGCDGAAQVVHAPESERRWRCTRRCSGFGARIHDRCVERTFRF